jgi:hypothetical protein
VGVEIASKQEESQIGRKALTDALSEFRKHPPAEQASRAGGLIALFKTEVDSLTRRARFAERALASLYSDLLEAPDPVAFLEQAKEAPRLIEAANGAARTAREERDAYAREIVTLRQNDAEVRVHAGA